MKITFSEVKTTPQRADALVFGVSEDKAFSPQLQALDKKTGGLIRRGLEASRFTGKKGQYLSVILPESAGAARVVLAGLGAWKDFSALAAESVGGGLVPQLNAAGAHAAAFIVEPGKQAPIDAATAAAHIGFGALLRSYRFDKYKTKQKPESKPSFAALNVIGANSKAAAALFARLKPVAEGIFFTRDLVTEPANVIDPETLADACRQLADLGVDVEVLGEEEMHALGMNALLGVGQGSAKESQLVIMRWPGADKKGKSAAPLAIVGKGVTFDTGGISIKPASGMEEMKWDMGGAGTVIGLMRALALRKAKVNVVGVAGLVENMPGGNAQRPGDVVKSMSGQTIEVLNTDAEGRLVLADALWYTQERFKPRLVIDLATLTGAIIISLGTSRAGLFCNDDELADQLFAAGKETGDEVWRMPLGEVYDKQIDSQIADMQNIGQEREAGSITAAQFLKRFIKDGTPWAHLDIAGTAWSKKDRDTCPKGATAFGVRLLDALIAEHYEA